jgi:signal transduction histidine kinase
VARLQGCAGYLLEQRYATISDVTTTNPNRSSLPTVPPPPARTAGDRVRSRAVRSGLHRRRDGQVVAGVASGLGARLGVDPILIRIGFAVLAFAGGAGVLLYGVLWAAIPLEGESGVRLRRPATAQQGVALGLILLGVLLLLRAVGLWFGDALVGPIVVAAVGSAVLWARSDDEQRASWSRISGRVPAGALERAAAGPVSPARVVIGTLLVAGAGIGFIAANDALVAAGDLVLAVIAAVAGIALLFGPWLWRLIDQLGAERRERVRQEERAELAAHLHDSVLQTLAMIQRSSDQPRRMVALARSQERELRGWLYGGAATTGPATTVVERATHIAEEIETTHEVSVELVTVGDGSLDDQLHALLAATREASINAARHAGVDHLDVYLEVGPDEALAFVRDRGRGFDPDAVPDDRHGIRGSIVDRIERHGGTATISSAPGEGTEIELCVPRSRRRTDAPEAPQ